jgi:hypothetical protein
LPSPWRTAEVALGVDLTLMEGPLEELLVGLAGEYPVMEAGVGPPVDNKTLLNIECTSVKQVVLRS